MRSSWSSFCLYDNSIGTEKTQAEGWESAPWGGAIENGQHERKDRACKTLSVALRDWRTSKVLAYNWSCSTPR